MRLAEITHENSTVDGSEWPEDRFAALDFSGELYSDQSYHMGCLKYVPCSMDEDPTCGHRVRSIFPDAKPIKTNGSWMWQVKELSDEEIS